MPKEERGWMIVLRADIDFKSDGGEDEVFVVIYKSLARAKEECRKHMKELMEADPEIETDEIEWAQDQETSARKIVYFGRPKASMR
jgi:hypothetical protein